MDARFPTLIYDADPVIYAAGFAAQKTIYEYVYQDENGALQQGIWSDGNAALAFFREHPEYVVLDKTSHVEVQDPGFARQAARTMFLGTINAACERWDLPRDQVNVEVYLSGPGNFRSKIAKISEYKANRAPPPVHYQVVRNYVTDQWNAIVVSGIEADDAVAIRQRECVRDGVQSILATIDKDLDQVPGLHYNYQKHVFYDVSDEEAKRWFWIQCLAGDTTDNVQGCYRVGAGKAAEIIDPAIDEGWSDEEIWSLIVNNYQANMERFPAKFPEGMTAGEAALETARLVKMLDYDGQLWTPPGEPDGELGELE